jgi:cell division protein FtsW (lipid II flippase)
MSLIILIVVLCGLAIFIMLLYMTNNDKAAKRLEEFWNRFISSR